MKYHNKPDPANTQQIKEWETFFSIAMPSDLKKVLTESNGPVLYVEKTGKELQFLSTLDAAEYYEAYNFKKFCENSIPISMDGCGDFVVYKRDKDIIKGIYAIQATNMGWQDAVFLKESIQEVIEMEKTVEEILFS